MDGDDRDKFESEDGCGGEESHKDVGDVCDGREEDGDERTTAGASTEEPNMVALSKAKNPRGSDGLK